MIGPLAVAEQPHAVIPCLLPKMVEVEPAVLVEQKDFLLAVAALG